MSARLPTFSQLFLSRTRVKDSGESNDGTCGNEARWTLDTATGELRISGTGRLHDFVNGKKIPWEKHQSIIRKAFIDDGITYIGFQAFAYCTALTEVRLPSSLATIGVQAFAYCKSLSAVRLPEGVGSLGDYAFSHCYGLREAVLPSSLRHIGKGAFCSCQSLQRVSLPDGITEIGSQAFADCKHLSEVELPPCLTRLKSYCFSGCSSLASLNLPPSATHIGDYAFSGCSALTSVSLPEGVADVGVQAFADCRSLRQVAFPASLRRLAPRVLAGCRSLCSLWLPFPGSGTASAFSCFGELFGTTPDTEMRQTPQEADEGKETNYYLPASLTELHILEGCEVIPPRCLSHCYCLHELHLPASLYLVGHRAFAGCAGLTAIFSHAPEPPSIHADTFEGVRPNAYQVHVPAGCGEAYRQAPHWNNFPHIEETSADGAGS